MFKNIYIKTFAVMAVVMTVMLMLSYMLIGVLFRFLTLMVMAAGFVICLRKVSADGLTVKKLVFSLLSAVGAMAVSVFLSGAVVIVIFALGSSGGHHI